MKITLNQLVFNSIKEFTDYLVRNYEQIDSATKEIDLFISCDNYDPDSAKELSQFLLRPNSCLYNIHLVPENLNPEQKKLEQLLNNIYLFNKKSKLKDEQWGRIFTVLRENAHPEKIELLLNILSGLEVHSILINEVSALFKYPPYPALDFLAEKLREDSRELKDFIDSFDRDPMGARAPRLSKEGNWVRFKDQILNEQFETTQIQGVISNIQNALNETGVSSKEQYDLAQQAVYVNAIGKDYPLKIADKTYIDLTKLSRDKLRELSDLLIMEIKKPDSNEEDVLRAKLKLIAIMREQYFRSTGLFLNATQIISVLLSLHHQEQNLLMEMGTDRNQSAPIAILAAMQWVFGGGGTVDVCFANHGLAAQDYKDKGDRNFFTYLGIPSSVIEANSEAGTYQIEGINYSTISDLTSYHTHAEIEDEELSKDKYGYPVSSNLILNNPDFSIVNGRILSNFSLLFDRYKEKGRIVRIAEIEEISSELVKQSSKFDMDKGYRFSSFKKNLQDESNIHIPDSQEHFESIKQAILNVAPGQPIVLVAKDANQAARLSDALTIQFKDDNKKYEIGIFTGDEPEKGKQKWIKEQAGNANTITIITKPLLQDVDFKTKYPKGFLTIQAYLDTPDITKKIINGISKDGKPGHYVVVYEGDGVKSHSWAFKTKEDKQNILKSLEKIQQGRREEVAVKQYFIQSVSNIQQVVLSQFEEWQAFLHLIYPKSEWGQLDNELFVQREELSHALKKQWIKCLEDSDPKKMYSNPYVRRDEYRLQTSELETALQEYEQSVTIIWNNQRSQLKAKTENRFVEGSINALRCKYLENVELSEQIKWNKLAARLNKKEAAQEKKRSHRYLESATEVNGAMLSYFDGDLSLID
nr:hypothetical protein [Legionella norrlandica]